MGWETRSGRQYYYRARKIDGRVHREYIGTGEIAALIAQMDDLDRERQHLRVLEERDERARISALDGAVARLDELADVLVRGSLVLAGYERHNRGEWRRRRGQEEC
ncbi:MAG: hypothetical protein U0822_22115 [Anaerolineae bacterium]